MITQKWTRIVLHEIIYLLQILQWHKGNIFHLFDTFMRSKILILTCCQNYSPGMVKNKICAQNRDRHQFACTWFGNRFEISSNSVIGCDVDWVACQQRLWLINVWLAVIRDLSYKLKWGLVTDSSYIVCLDKCDSDIASLIIIRSKPGTNCLCISWCPTPFKRLGHRDETIFYHYNYIF